MEASDTTVPEVPQAPQTTDDLLRAVLEEQQAHRAEVANLRAELAASKQPVPQAAPATPLSAEDAFAERMKAVGNHDYYCPACGLLYDYQQRCTGKSESPHPPVEVVSTDELKAGDPSQHTAPEYVQA